MIQEKIIKEPPLQAKGLNFQVDPTLTKYGQAADARVVGTLLNKLTDSKLGGVDNCSLYVYTDPEKYGEDKQAGVMAIKGFYDDDTENKFVMAGVDSSGNPTVVWSNLPNDNKQLLDLLDLSDLPQTGIVTSIKELNNWLNELQINGINKLEIEKCEKNNLPSSLYELNIMIKENKEQVAYAHRRIDEIVNSDYTVDGGDLSWG